MRRAGAAADDTCDNGPYFHYWTQNFGRRNAVYPVIVERELYETACAAVDLYTYGAGVYSHMRFSNDGANWSAWMPFSPVAGYPATADLDLSAQTVTTTQSWTACDTITAGDVTFTARTIVLTDGFSVAAGGSFRAITR